MIINASILINSIIISITWVQAAFLSSSGKPLQANHNLLYPHNVDHYTVRSELKQNEENIKKFLYRRNKE